MYVGIARLEYRIAHAQSLKAKRHVLRKMLDRVRSRYRVSAGEVDYQDKWQRTAIGVAVVGPDGPQVERVLSRITQFLDDLHLAEPLSRHHEVIRFAGSGEAFDDLGGLRDADDTEAGPDFEDWQGLEGLDTLGEAARRRRPFGDDDP